MPLYNKDCSPDRFFQFPTYLGELYKELLRTQPEVVTDRGPSGAE